jgi:RNA recognition motif-containing protein
VAPYRKAISRDRLSGIPLLSPGKTFGKISGRNKVVTNIFVGNLDITVTEQQLREAFAAHGAVETVTIVVDRDTGAPRGIAFVEMTQTTEALAAIAALDGKILNERPMTVNEARPRLLREPTSDSESRDHRRHRM